MIERIITFSVRNPVVVLLLSLAVAGVGVYSLWNTPIDAIPDLSENQVIVFADWEGRSPREVEDQVTYPLSVNLQGLAGVKSVRATSEFGFSMLNIVFDDNVDFYFARQRVMERLSTAATFLPPGVTPYLAPDATALGQIFWYTVEGDGYDSGELRAVQDWFVRYQLYSVPGVAEVASVGGYPREYQIDVDPAKLRAFNISLGELYSAVARSNSAVGGRIVQKANSEYIVRSVGWIRSTEDVERIVVKSVGGSPIYLGSVAHVQLGSTMRRASLEKNGNEAVGGVVIMRFGENPLEVTKRIREKIVQLQAGLPPGVRIVPFYERTQLIERAMHTVTGTLYEEMFVASAAILFILWHFRSALVVCLTLPLSVLISFIFMRVFHIPSNIMSLSGIAISIGVLVDSSIVMVENATHHLHEHFGRERVRGDTRELVLPALTSVGRPIFFSVLIMVLSFIPVFALGGIEGRMFNPLAYTKTFAMLGVSILAITFVPALIPIMVRGRLRGEEESWLVRSVIEVYRPVLRYLLVHPWPIVLLTSILFVVGAVPMGNHVVLAVALVISTAGALWAASCERTSRASLTVVLGSLACVVGLGLIADVKMKKLGREFMPPLDEGTVLDMPVTIPRASITEVTDDLKARNAVLRAFPEVELVVGKAGRAETPTDPAPPDMVETVINMRPRELWPKRALRFATARAQTEAVFAAFERQGWIKDDLAAEDRDTLVNSATMLALEPFDRDLRQTALSEFQAFEHTLGADLSEKERNSKWRERVRHLNWELFDRAAPLYTALALEHVRQEADKAGYWKGPAAESQEFAPLRAELKQKFAANLYLWPRTKDELVKELDTVTQMPGWGNIWTQPIINRVDMLATGVRTMIGVKVYGNDLAKIQHVSEEIAAVLRNVQGAVDVFPDQIVGEGYLEITIDRERAARYGINVGDVQDVVETALGGRVITTTVEGRERFPVRIRYARAFREDEEAVKNLLITPSSMTAAASAASGSGGMASTSGMGGAAKMGAGTPAVTTSTSSTVPAEQLLQIPLAQVADVKIVSGPSMIKSENGLLRSYVQLNVRDRDLIGFVEDARRAVDEKVKLPPGMYLEWSGQFEHQVRAARTLSVVVPLVILVIFVMLYLTYHDLFDALLMLLAVPGAVAGGVLFQWLWGYNFSVAVWVGFIACFGLATETGIVMLVYLREAVQKHGGLANLTLDELRQAVLEGAVHRLRPKLLTEGTIIIGLAPMLWATGTGAEIMKPMAAPVLGGILVADEVIDLLLPVLFYHVRAWRWRRLHAEVSQVEKSQVESGVAGGGA